VLRLLFTIAILPSVLAAATAFSGCAGEITFSHWYDLFVDGRNPDFAELRGKAWRLKGMVANRHSLFGYGSGLDPTGYAVNAVVPELHFTSRENLSGIAEHADLLFSSVHDEFVLRENWGARGFLSGTPAFRVDWEKIPASRRGAIGFKWSLHERQGPELFADPQLELPLSSTSFIVQCRRHGAALLCLGELMFPIYENRPNVPSDILWFEP